MQRIAVGLWGGMPVDDLIGCTVALVIESEAAPISPEHVGYLPSLASRAGILRTVETLATA